MDVPADSKAPEIPPKTWQPSPEDWIAYRRAETILDWEFEECFQLWSALAAHGNPYTKDKQQARADKVEMDNEGRAHIGVWAATCAFEFREGPGPMMDFVNARDNTRYLAHIARSSGLRDCIILQDANTSLDDNKLLASVVGACICAIMNDKPKPGPAQKNDKQKPEAGVRKALGKLRILSS